MKTVKIIFKILFMSLLIWSCEKDEVRTIEKTKEVIKEVTKEVPVVQDTKFDQGFFVSAEGNFGNKNGSIAYVTNDLSTTTNFIYKKVNDIQLGGLIQSVVFGATNAYVILNDANSIVIMDKVTFKRKAVVTSGLKNPRYMTIVGDKGYITNWGEGADETDDYIAVLNLTTNKIDDSTISLPNGVEQIISKENKLYVSHKGAFSSNNIISVVDLSSNNSVVEIKVKDNPDELFFASNGNLVVLSGGKPTKFGPAPFYKTLERTTSAISFIDINTNTISKELIFDTNKGSGQMATSNDKIYYNLDNKIYEISETAIALSESTEILEVGNIYGFNVKEGKLYTVSFAFTTFSDLTVYDITSKNIEFSSAVGLGASKIYFQ